MQSGVAGAAGVLALAQAVPYVLSIVHGNTRPSSVSYLIWACTSWVSLAIYSAAGGGETSLAILAAALTASVIFLLSLRTGFRRPGGLEAGCMIMVGCALVIWAGAPGPNAALFAATAAWLLGYAPTIRKARHYPDSEHLGSWVLALVASALNVLALGAPRWRIAALPVSVMVVDGVVVLAILRGRRLARCVPAPHTGRRAPLPERPGR
jgi:hypothetical protein